jgi:predicted RecB family nuclease
METTYILYVLLGIFGILVLIIFIKLLPLIKAVIKGKEKKLFGYDATIIYDDSTSETEMLSYEDDKIKLIGKPDFVLQLKNKDYIIVDAKSGKLDAAESSIKLQGYMQQIINYFLIVEHSLKIKPKYGELYFLEDNNKFTIYNNPEVIKQGLNNLHIIGEAKKNGIRAKNKSYVTCEFCHYKTKCKRKVNKR